MRGGLGAALGQFGMSASEDGFGCWPIDTAIGDGLAVNELIEGAGKFLRTGDEVAFEHKAADGGMGIGCLIDDGGEDLWLSFGILVAIIVAAIDHDGGWQGGFAEL